MSRRAEKFSLALAFGALLIFLRTQPAWSDVAQTKFELGAEGAALTEGLGMWKGLSGTFSFAATPKDRLGLELIFANRFGEQGFSGTASWQRDYDESGYQFFSVVGTAAGSFWPSIGISTEYLHKFGADKDWVLGVGGGANAYRTSNHDFFGIFEAIHYFPYGWVIEVGTRTNLSDPGAVIAPRAFAAFSWIPAEGMEYVLKVDGGDEAYQLVGPENLQTRFQSIGFTGEAFLPIGGGRQLHLRLEQYENPFYGRTQGYVGLIQRF